MTLYPAIIYNSYSGDYILELFENYQQIENHLRGSEHLVLVQFPARAEEDGSYEILEN